MKRIFLKIFSVLLIFSSLLALLSCDNNEENNGFKNELGLNFKIYDDMAKLNVGWANLCYQNKDITYFVIAYTKEELNDPEIFDLRENIPVPEFTSAFIAFREYDAEYEYDAEKNVATFAIIVEGAYCFFAITRNSDIMYVVGMECDEEKKDIYEPIFREWANIMYLDSKI